MMLHPYTKTTHHHLRKAPARRRTTRCNFAVRVKDLKLSLGEGSERKQVLQGVNMDVKQGTLHMLLGANGCGKSTLLQVLGGLLQSQSGRVEVTQPTGFVFQNPDNQAVMPTVAADVAFGLGRYDLPPAEILQRVSEALNAVNLQGFDQRPCHTLSGGQLQRVAIAGVLAEQPRVMLCDELTTFVDDEDQQSVIEAVRRVVDKAGDVTAIWVTHRLEELDQCDAVSIMEEGRIVMSGSPAEAKAFLRKTGATVPGA